MSVNRNWADRKSFSSLTLLSTINCLTTLVTRDRFPVKKKKKESILGNIRVYAELASVLRENIKQNRFSNAD